jgi:hypothetical protein
VVSKYSGGGDAHLLAQPETAGEAMYGYICIVTNGIHLLENRYNTAGNNTRVATIMKVMHRVSMTPIPAIPW